MILFTCFTSTEKIAKKTKTKTKPFVYTNTIKSKMPDITTLYHELIRHKQESLDPIDRQLLHQQQATHKINRTQSHQGDIFTRECLKIVRVYWVFVTKKN